MKSLTGLLAALVLILVAVVPAGAQETIPTHGVCTKTGELIPVGSSTGSIETPLLPLDETTATFLIDLEGQPTTKKASLNVDMTWGDPTDFDLDVNGTSSVNFNFDGTFENVSLSSLAHCSTVTVTATNFAGNPLASLALAFKATAK